MIPSITDLAEAQDCVEQHLSLPLSDEAAERFRQHIRMAYARLVAE